MAAGADAVGNEEVVAEAMGLVTEVPGHEVGYRLLQIKKGGRSPLFEIA